MDTQVKLSSLYGLWFMLCKIIVCTGNYNSTDCSQNFISNGTSPKCVFKTVHHDILSKVNQMADGAKVIYLYVYFDNFTEVLFEEDKSNVYRPLSWVRTAGRNGRILQILQPKYEIFSLSSLGLGIESVDVGLLREPLHCLTNKNATVISEEIKEFLLNNFQTSGTSGHICNLNIAPQNGKALFYYICCHKTVNGQTKCHELKSDKYITVIFVCIFLVNFFAFMFSPLLIPANLYRRKFKSTSYEHHLNRPVTFSVRKTSTKTKGDDVFPISSLEQMTEFKKTVEAMRSEVTYDVTTNKIDLVVDLDRLLPSNRAPVGLIKSLYSALVNCKIRKKPSIRDCCESNILGPCRPCNRALPWYKLLRPLMQLVMYILIGKVWIVRLHFFYVYEESERQEREKAAKFRNLELAYTGNLTWYLTPIHTIFMICYLIFLVDFVVLGILSKQVINTLKNVMRNCLRDMREISKRNAIGWSVHILFHPFKHCGIFGIMFAWLYYIFAIPIVLGTLAFYYLPTINLLVRLVIYFVAYLFPNGQNCIHVGYCMKFWEYIQTVLRLDILTKNESIGMPATISKKRRLLELLIICACFITVISFALLSMECIVFTFHTVTYNFIGAIINASHTLKYITLIFLFGFYASDCFGKVTLEYLAFNTFLNDYLVSKMRENVLRTSSSNHELQTNAAFKVSLEDSTGRDDKPDSLLIADRKIKWKMNSLILFLDRNGTPYITSKFFFDTCNLQQVGVPGPLMTNLLHAMQRFLIICVFLIFAASVILGFGEEYQISAINQMFAILASGCLPLILRVALFKQPKPVIIDSENLSFKSKLGSKIEQYTQIWEASDIRITSKSAKQTNVDGFQTDVATTDENNVSKEKDAILKDMKNDSGEKVDIVIYDEFTL